MAEAKKTEEKKAEPEKKPSENAEIIETRYLSEFVKRFRDVTKDNVRNTAKSPNTGFYYDSQLNDPFLSISLHANKKLEEQGKGEQGKKRKYKWIPWPGDHLEPLISEDEWTEGNVNNNDGKVATHWGAKYGVEPIAKSILTEDFIYSISNNWSDYNGGNFIESMFEAVKPWAPLLNKLGKGIQGGIDSMKGEGGYGSTVVQGVESQMQNLLGLGINVPELLKAGSTYLNKALYVQGTRFSYYNGTEFNFNNMEMKFIAFSDYVNVGGKWEFQSVEDYINKTLRPYAMGTYSPTSFGINQENVIGKTIMEYAGFMDPPGGFRMDTKALDNCLEGTLRLNIGGTWAIDNLILKNMNVTMSRVQAKHPEKEGVTVPLYADIVLQLAPAAVLVDTGYARILEHKGLTEIREQAFAGYSEKLRELKEKFSYVL